ncbi:MAG: hypothetical protein Q9162_001066 [Coniocarpon cinnabarinum]
MSELLQFILEHEKDFRSRTRLASLYSDFALLKDTNPDGFNANVLAWRSALQDACRAGLTPAPTDPVSGEKQACTLVIKTGEELARQLEGKDLGQPLALGAVLNEATINGYLIPLRSFLESKERLVPPASIRRSWIPSISIPTPYDVARWVFSQIGILSSRTTQLPNGEFVALKNLEEASNLVLRRAGDQASTSSSQVYSLRTFTAAFASILPDGPPLSSVDIAALLTFLSRDQNAVSLSRPVYTSSTTSEDTNEQLVIKFRHPSSDASPLPITQQDITIASLKTLSYELSQQVSTLEHRVDQLNASIRAVIPNSSSSSLEKNRALAFLRQRKGLESTLQRRLDSQTQVEKTLTSIDDAVTNLEMTKAMEASAGVLEDLNKQIGGPERVAEIMDRLADAKADNEEIGRILRQDAEAEINDENIEEEFEALLRDSQPSQKEEHGAKQREGVSRAGTLPEAPSTSISLPTVPVTDPSEAQGSHRNAEDALHEDAEAKKTLEAGIDELSLRASQNQSPPVLVVSAASTSEQQASRTHQQPEEIGSQQI